MLIIKTHVIIQFKQNQMEFSTTLPNTFLNSNLTIIPHSMYPWTQLNLHPQNVNHFSTFSFLNYPFSNLYSNSMFQYPNQIPNIFSSQQIPLERSLTINPASQVLEENIILENVPQNILNVNQQFIKNQQRTLEQYDESYRPESVREQQPQSKDRKVQRRRRGDPYYWTVEENNRYIEFLLENESLLRMRYEERGKFRINVAMSQKVRTRTSLQCHNHHYKMLGRYGGMQNLLCKIQKTKQSGQQGNKDNDQL